MIADFETGNPPEGWESEGQFRIADLRKGRRGETEKRRDGRDAKKQAAGRGQH
jgi:hypothetical protein